MRVRRGGRGIAVTKGRHRLGILAFAAGYVILGLVVALVRPIGLRLLLAFLSLAPILWGTRVLLAARMPPAGLSRSSLEVLRSLTTERPSPARRLVDSLLRELHALETVASRDREAGADREEEAMAELERIRETLHDLVEQAVRVARTERVPGGSEGTGDEGDRL